VAALWTVLCPPEVRFDSELHEGTVQMIVIGSDPHERSHTCGLERLLTWARGLDPERVWAIEDCRHVSGRLERFLIARGERVVRVPPKVMAGRRRAARERGKSDAIDALAVARAALEEGVESLPTAQLEGPAREIKLLLDHREDLVAERTRVGPLTAAKLVAEIAGIERFRSQAKLARIAGVAPIPASSGKRTRFRLDRGGNRQLNAAFHRIAVTQVRCHPPAQDYVARRLGEGKTKREALRCLKRHLVRTVFNTMMNPIPTALDGAPAFAIGAPNGPPGRDPFRLFRQRPFGATAVLLLPRSESHARTSSVLSKAAADGARPKTTPTYLRSTDLAVVPAEEGEEIAVAVKRGELSSTELCRRHPWARHVVEHARGLQLCKQGVDI
jgi:transposase